MGYRRMTIEDLKSIYRRLKEGQTISAISLGEGFDRKTIRGYLKALKEIKSLLKGNESDEDALHKQLLGILPANNRANPIQAGFNKHLDEIKGYITDKDHPVKPKTAYRIIKQKYDLKGSYESFKVFAHKAHLKEGCEETFPRLETPPGEDTQIDYCIVGYHTDHITGKRRRVNGFIGKLASSRLPFVEFTYTQKQDSFVMSHIHMIEFYGGVSKYLTIDNLKAGVIKPHIYDPKLNKAYSEFAEHYGTFINPCIPGHAKGKAKVERQVQEIRELYRELIALHPAFTLKELNQEALKWCRDSYGMKKHGTTGVEPLIVFEREEKSHLLPLNPIRFEVPIWKAVKVHSDQFFSLDKKRYAMPKKYRGQSLNTRRTGNLLKVFDGNHTLLRQYVISKDRMHYYKGDFPESYEAMMQGEYPRYLITQAAKYGPHSEELIKNILKPHAFINARIAKGVLRVLEDFKSHSFLQEICLKAIKKKLYMPKQIKQLLEEEKKQSYFDFIVPRSALGEAMIRDIREYIN
jgi:hypothetical protein